MTRTTQQGKGKDDDDDETEETVLPPGTMPPVTNGSTMWLRHQKRCAHPNELLVALGIVNVNAPWAKIMSEDGLGLLMSGFLIAATDLAAFASLSPTPEDGD